MIEERLVDGQQWYRVVDAAWDDPLDDSFAQAAGGRWNPPGSWRTLYLNEDLATARSNVARFAGRWPYQPEDLVAAHGPDLAIARLPRRQTVADLHTSEGLRAAGLPVSYPLDEDGSVVTHPVCQEVGRAVKGENLRGVHCRTATSPHGEGRELAWFPASSRSRAALVDRVAFGTWYWT